MDYLKKEHVLWVLGSWQIVVERYPVLGERVTVATAPYDFKGFMGYRNFLMTDEDGNRLACGNTIWSLIDTENGHPVRPSKEIIEPYIIEDKLDMEYAPRKIAVPDSMRKGESVIIRPHHLDTNHHVNNGQYVRIALDSLGKEYQIKQLRTEYKKQSYLNDVLIPYVSNVEDKTCVIVLVDDMDVTRCVVEIKTV